MADENQQHYDVIVVGVGSVGSAACYHLAKRGARVLGIDAFEIPHQQGSHHGHSRMIRQSYYEHPDYVPLIRRAYELWDELQEESHTAREFFTVTGGLYLGANDGTIVSGSRRSAEQHDLPHKVLSRDQVLERFPAFLPAQSHVGFYEDRCGFLVPELAIEAHATAAQKHGAQLHTGEALVGWSASATGVEVTTDKAKYTAGQLVIASGIWSAQVIAELGIKLEVTRQVLAWFEPLGDPARLAPERFPCWYVETDPPYGHYGFPYSTGDPGLKLALHKPGEPVDPAEELEPPRPTEIAALRAVLDRYLPGCAGEVSHATTCRYTNSPDGHFIIGKHPAHPQVNIACGLSGHGFKFASVLGEIMADLALNGRSELPAEFLSPARFS